MCLVVQRERTQAALLNTKAHVQAAIGGESAGKAYEEFVNAVRRVDNEDANSRMREAMKTVANIKEIHKIGLAGFIIQVAPTFVAITINNLIGIHGQESDGEAGYTVT